MASAPSTANFCIGDRAKISTDGRIGRVAFVGRTQFKEGDWIGIVLDKPEGKNNGTVNGIKYFECAENHGLFCPPSKLVKLAPSPAPVHSPSPGNIDRVAASPSHSVAGSVAFSVAASTAFKEHSPYAELYGFDLGDRVLADGKPGKVKFLDSIGDQVYAGLILDKPDGDCDGKFQGTEYFKCYPKYGLFLPAENVKKVGGAVEPKVAVRATKASMLRNNAAMSKAGGGSGMLANSGPLRTSRDSLNSMASSQFRSSPAKRPPIGNIRDIEIIASLKKCLQEKEGHLAALSNELEEKRAEAERYEDTNASLIAQLDNVSQRLADAEKRSQQLQSKYDAQFRRLEDLSFCFTEAEVQKKELEDQLRTLKDTSTSSAINESTLTNDSRDVRDIEMIASLKKCLQEKEGQENVLFVRLSKLAQRSEDACTEAAIQKKDLEDQLRTLMETNASLASRIAIQSSPIAVPAVIHTFVQTNPLPEPKKPAVTTVSATQTIAKISTDFAIQTEALAELKRKSIAAKESQTQATDLKHVSVQSEPMVEEPACSFAEQSTSKPDREVLELSVTQLDLLKSTALLNGGDTEDSPKRLKEKFSEKCNENQRLSDQVDFLNSIIADQSLKLKDYRLGKPDGDAVGVEAQKKIPSAHNPNSSNVASSKRRLYCEHCELFDSHTGDDCPKEEARRAERTAHIATSPSNATRVPKALQRPYCDNCEEFGHEMVQCPRGTSSDV